VRVLEVGFGTGIGWEETRRVVPSGKALHYFSLEIDEDLVRWNELKLRRQEHEGLVWYAHDDGPARLCVIIGDARTALPRWSFDAPFDAIYQDAFAPRKNPTLWTTEWFSLLRSLSAHHAVMSTYSSGIAIRKAMHEAGWGIQSGPGFQGKNHSTRAHASGASDAELIANLYRSPILALKDTP
jgi:tRNA U34 5-methylaminomethyl-2-thiouridine-forming methyltransferase MnmC